MQLVLFQNIKPEKTQMKAVFKNTLREHLPVLISLLKATQLTRSISIPEVGLFSQLSEVNSFYISLAKTSPETRTPLNVAANWLK